MEYVVVEILRQKHYWSLYNAIVVHTHFWLMKMWCLSGSKPNVVEHNI